MTEQLTFANPEWLYLLLLAVPLLVIKIVSATAAREGLEKVTSTRLREHLITARRPLGDWGRFSLQLIGLALLTVALARPQKGFVEEVTRVEGRNIIIGVDTSRSMLAEDITRGGRTSRLRQAKLAALDLIDGLRGDRIGLIAFAGTAFMQAPITSDHQAVGETVEQLNTYVIQRGGTNLAAAIKLARERLGEVEAARNALILFTDGDDLEGTALEEAKKAAEDDITIITVGVGSPNPTIVPDPEARGAKKFLKDETGELVKSSMDAESLEKIAKATNGRFFNLQTGLMNQQLVDDVLSNISYSSSEDKLKRTPRERYALPLGLGLGCIAAAYIATLWGSRPAARPAFAALILLSLTLPQPARAAPADDAYSAYDKGDFEKAQTSFSDAAEKTKNRRQQEALAFGAGSAAYQNADYAQAIDFFSQALVAPDHALQELAHYNLGNTLFKRGEIAWKESGPEKLDDVIREWQDAAGHYGAAIDLSGDNDDAQANLDIVEKLLEELKKIQKEQQEQQDEEEEKKEDQEKKDEEQKSEEEQKDESGEKEDGEEAGDEEQPQPEEGEESSESGEEGKEPGEPGDGETGKPGDEKPGEEGEEKETTTPGEEEQPDPDDEVDETTGYSKNQARENLEKLSDEQSDLGLLRRRKLRQKQKRYYKDW